MEHKAIKNKDKKDKVNKTINQRYKLLIILKKKEMYEKPVTTPPQNNK